MHVESICPIFLFSLPRSGSTLLQRILTTHSCITTTPEPWVLLPLLSMRRDDVFADYGHATARRAIADFRSRLEGGEGGFDDELRRFVLRIYRRAAGSNATYFLDKTPRYHLIASEIIDLLPSARVVILWRNPLAIMASIIQTWGKGKWNLYRYNVDFYRGLPLLVDLARQDQANVISIRYEDLVTRQKETLKRVCDHLDLNLDELDVSPPTLDGVVGDPTQTQYDSISSASLDKWKTVLANPLRKRSACAYLDWLGTDRLGIMGYAYDDLVDAINKTPLTLQYMGRDVIGFIKGVVWPFGEYEMYKHKLESSSDSLVHHG